MKKLSLFVSTVLVLMCGAEVGCADETAERLFGAAQAAIGKAKYEQAEKLLGQAIDADPKFAPAHYHRGRVRFRLNRLKGAVADLDRYVKLEPKAESRQWERGIAYYYAGKFREGAAQFVLYQTYHDNDVENSVWRFLCQARYEGVKKARSVMLPIKNDRRVPMMEIFEMFRGTKKPDDVLEATRRGNPSPEVLEGRLFYARLYLGLYYEAIGDKKRAREYILLAADKHKDSRRINNYMWAVADIHAKQIRAKDKPKPKDPKSADPKEKKRNEKEKR